MSTYPLPGKTEDAGSTVKEQRRPRRLHEFLVGYWWLSATLFGLAVLWVLLRGYVLHQPFPFNTFLFRPEARFSDLTDYIERFERFQQPAFYAERGFHSADLPFAYGPPMAVLFWFWFSVFKHPVAAFIVLAFIVAAALTALVLTFIFWRCLLRRNISVPVAVAFAITTVLTSYPLMIVLDRANAELFVWIASSAALIAMVRRRWWLAATFVAFATSLKYFPLVLFALLIARKKWRELAWGILLTIGLSLTCLWIMGPTFGMAASSFVGNFRRMNDFNLFVDRPLEVGLQHSLFSVIRQLMFALTPWTNSASNPDLSWVQARPLDNVYFYYQIVVAIAAIVLYFLVIRKLPILNQMIALTVCCVLLPGWSGDYTLLHLYVPWGLLALWIIDHPEQTKLRLLWCLLPFAVIFTPQPYLIVGIRGFSGQLKAMALLTLLIAALCVPLREEALDSA